MDPPSPVRFHRTRVTDNGPAPAEVRLPAKSAAPPPTLQLPLSAFSGGAERSSETQTHLGGSMHAGSLSPAFWQAPSVESALAGTPCSATPALGVSMGSL